MIDYLSPRSEYYVVMAMDSAHSHTAVSNYPLLSQQDKKSGVLTSVVQCTVPMTPPTELETAKVDENARGKWCPKY